MVFSSLPPYLDPSNWQQQPNNHHHIIGSSGANPLLPLPAHAQAAAPPPGGGGTGPIRPSSMSERARVANIPMPETALKCPRCESTNTKFCYFNNYSLSQPRHFCKTCRRYWTRGGALRNVPVGGGCRRNKRSKSTSSKSSPASSDPQATTSTSTSALSPNSGGGAAASMLGLTPPFPQLRFMSPLGQLGDSYDGDHMGLNYTGISAPAVGSGEMSYQSSLLGGGGGMASLLSGGGIEPWRLQQFPFMGGLEPPPPGMYFQGNEPGFMGGEPGQPGPRPKLSGSLLSQLASVKMEENHDRNLSRQVLGGIPGSGQWNSTTNWTDLSSFSSSSTSNPL